MSDQPVCPDDSRHNHEERFIPGQPGVIPAPPPMGGEDPAPGVPTRGRGKTKTEIETTSEATDEVASVVEEDA